MTDDGCSVIVAEHIVPHYSKGPVFWPSRVAGVYFLYGPPRSRPPIHNTKGSTQPVSHTSVLRPHVFQTARLHLCQGEAVYDCFQVAYTVHKPDSLTGYTQSVVLETRPNLTPDHHGHAQPANSDIF